jgi:hypothetical protein
MTSQGIASIAGQGTWLADFFTRLTSELLAVLIGGVLGGALVRLIQWLLEKFPPGRLPRARRKVLRGHWHGKIIQFEKRSIIPNQMEVEFEFDPGWRIVSGTFSFSSPVKSRGQVTNEFKGRFLTDQIFSVQYIKTEPEIIGCGVILFEFSEDAHKLHGRLAGFSSHFGELFATKIELTKTV